MSDGSCSATFAASAFDSLSKHLPEWTADGYPYDAILVLAATGDNGPASISQTSIVRQWNSTYDNPKIVVATPEQFFQHLHDTYGDAHPVYRGDWGGFWDSGTADQPHSLATIRHVHDATREAQTLGSVAAVLGLSAYPSATDRFIREQMLQFDDHNGGGAPWPGEMTNGEALRQSTIFIGYPSRADSANSVMLNSSLPLLSAQVTTPEASIVVWNTLSWSRTALVRIAVPDWSTVQLYDPVHQEYPAIERLAATGEVEFVARDVPGIGYATYYRRSGAAVGGAMQASPRASGDRTSGDATIENEYFRVTASGLDGSRNSIGPNRVSSKTLRILFSASTESTTKQHFFCRTNQLK